ncbi:hypothetical protein L226DRAFT_576739 [Lentinus tigrinus ALCF2SS1-7]|uniref:uncharacterized protein n=1 Tax=Lentinus tigrinus ALCF2SS1-7 TaxID=1328758 RepID=UPI001165F572|nr:hypothetical protein L226DRAFT_576739 [Lentinus tigrinus ALCF2SS1-7]
MPGSHSDHPVSPSNAMLHIDNFIRQEFWAIPDFSVLSTSAQHSLVNFILDCAQAIEQGHRASLTGHSICPERTISHALQIRNTAMTTPFPSMQISPDPIVWHVGTVTFPDGCRLLFPTPHSSVVSLRIIDVLVREDIISHSVFDEDFIDIVDLEILPLD